MRVFFAVPSYWPSQDGVANITGYLAEGLASRGHEVLVFTSAGNGGLQELPDEENHIGVKIERMRVYVRWPLKLKGRDKKSTPRVYFNRIKSYAPDVLVVVCSQTWTFDWLIPHLDELKCPKVFYSHGYSKWLEQYIFKEQLLKRNILGVWEQYLCKRYYDKLYQYIDKYDLAIYLSDHNNAVNYAKQHGLTNGAILENAIEDAFFRPEMKHDYREKTTEEISFLFVANYSENKNHEMLIKAYSEAAIGKSRLIFAGFEENDYSDYLKDYAQKMLGQYEEKKVDFNVHLSREQIIDLYRTSTVFVCPSKSETWSIVAHEAAAVAMPIISTNVGVYSQIEGALIVQNCREMRAALEKLYDSPEERKERGLAAYKWLMTRNCRTKDKVDWLESALNKLTEEKEACGSSEIIS